MSKRPAPNTSGAHSGIQAEVRGPEHSPSPGRPVHLRPVFVLAVFCGGALGTLTRYGLAMAIPAPDGWPLPTLLINLTGAFLLGIILEAVVRRGPDAGWPQRIRLSAGTGFMGAYTTYSALALETAQLGADQYYLEGALYAVLSLCGGVLASAAGIWVASSHHRKANRRASMGRQNG